MTPEEYRARVEEVHGQAAQDRLQSLRKDELIGIARDTISGYSRMTRWQLIEALREWHQSQLEILTSSNYMRLVNIRDLPVEEES